jgi:hypothetical protein
MLPFPRNGTPQAKRNGTNENSNYFFLSEKNDEGLLGVDEWCRYCLRLKKSTKCKWLKSYYTHTPRKTNT